MKTEKEKAKEQEIAEIYKNFRTTYHSRVKSALERMENKRKSLFCTTVSLVSIAYMIMLPIMLQHGIFTAEFLQQEKSLYPCLTGIIAALPIIIYFTVAAHFRRKIKKEIFPILLEPFQDFKYTPDEKIHKDFLENTNLFHQFDTIDQDDRFQGRYKKTLIDITEVTLIKKTKRVDKHGVHEDRYPIFSGLVIALTAPKNYLGHTIVIPKNDVGILETLTSRKGNLSHVQLEDPNFEKKYKMFTNDQVEARYIFTPTFMERFYKLPDIFKSRNVKTCFAYNKVIFALETNDMFEIAQLHSSLLNTKRFEQFFKEFCLVFEIIIELQLNEDIGL